MKSEDEVVKDFNEIVNMTADELEAFLKTEASETTGWSKDDGSGESIGHESGRKIVDILKRNPSKVPAKYTDEDKEHMRRVVSYCKRHLAQESHLKQEKSKEELEKTKSTRSLKNWGHDPLKVDGGASGTGAGAKEKPKSSGKPVSKQADKAGDEKKEAAEKPKSSAKPASKKAEKKDDPAKEEVKNGGGEAKAAEKTPDKPVSKKAEKPASKKSEKPVSKKAETSEKPKSTGKAAEAEKKPAGKAEVGEKREAEKEAPPAGKSEKPASKKAKTDKPVSEGTRKPPSRGAKKA